MYQVSGGLTDQEVQHIANILESNLVGARTQDGYGWLGVNLRYPEELFIREKMSILQKAKYSEKSLELHDLLKDKDTSNTLKIIVKGMEEAKFRWLRLLVDRIKIEDKDEKRVGELIIHSSLLNNSQIKNMEEILDHWNKGEKALGSLGKKLEREYVGRSDIFSLVGVDLAHIYAYLKREVDQPTDADKNLNKFAKNKLNTQKGKLFYSNELNDDSNKDPVKKFIYELLKEALYIERMRRSENEPSAQ